MAEQAIEDGKADIIALGRELIAAPELPSKVASGRLEDINLYVACFHCSDAGVIISSPITCTINASVGREGEGEIRPVKESKKIAINLLLHPSRYSGRGVPLGGVGKSTCVMAILF